MNTIKQLRTRLKLNQTEFADLIGVEQSQVSRWELGKQRPSLQSIWSIIRAAKARRVKVTFDDFGVGA